MKFFIVIDMQNQFLNDLPEEMHKEKIIVAVCDRLSQYDYNNDYITPTIERL